MKVFVALFALVAVASAGVLLPQSYGYGLGSSLLAAPLSYAASPLAYSAPLAYSGSIAHHAPLAYSAPIVAAAPAIQSGYVAATRGSIHTAPLPEGPLAASHHINTAPAPGTW
ncbi:cuticle protein 16.5-like isoform X4 [Aethina tumida]|uniref:cuticle protein 16.5-like isoform X2 n=1 Tax=Aethina tumida TaxID=116153 RepID=UPI00096B46B2|nr:cuticle protein 16.5-like isoform X2 [Aethina tumida]XP_049819111.1 cuticle protein 16.5-like isoform X4 [Aethina tumida]